jgi:hypothetical protein
MSAQERLIAQAYGSMNFDHRCTINVQSKAYIGWIPPQNEFIQFQNVRNCPFINSVVVDKEPYHSVPLNEFSACKQRRLKCRTVKPVWKPFWRWYYEVRTTGRVNIPDAQFWTYSILKKQLNLEILSFPYRWRTVGE